MADPRTSPVQSRKSALSPLMRAKSDAVRTGGDVVNFCPFECSDDALDEHGYCAHLIGFYHPPGEMYEPRVRVKDKGQAEDKIIVQGSKKLHMQSKFKLVRITSSYRVYSPTPNKALVRDAGRPRIDEATERENQLVKAIEELRDPELEGDWGEGLYANLKPVLPLATVATDAK